MRPIPTTHDCPPAGAARFVARCLMLLASVVLAMPRATTAQAVQIPSPNIAARSYVLLDQATGKVLAENNAHERVEPASITKVMTVYVAGQALAAGLISPTDEVVVSEKAWKMEGSRMFIEVGTRVTVDQLLDGIIVQSGNDASVALAEHVSGTEETFAALMNEQARKLGMTNSSFANATGLPDPATFATAYDLALLARALVRDFPELYQRFSHKEFTYNGIHQPNRNRLLYRDPSVDGIKTGHTSSAGYCLLTSASRDGMRLIAAVMGTESDTARTEASQALLNYGFRFFETRELYPAGAVIAQPRVWGGASETVRAGVPAAVSLVVPRGRYDEMKAVARIDEPLQAPLVVGQPLGAIVISLDDKPLEEIPLQALDAVDEGSLFSRLYDEFMLLFE